MTTRLLALSLGFLCAAALACADSGADPDANECLPAREPVPANYTITLAGFPELEAGQLIDPDGVFERELECMVGRIEDGDPTVGIEVALACPLADRGGASANVTLTTSDPGALAQLELGAAVSVSSYAYFEQGGDHPGPVFRALGNTNYERHVLRDADGLLFAAIRGGLELAADPVEVELDWSCADWQPCSEDDDISGFVRLSSGDDSVEVGIGEAGTLTHAGQAWTLRLFQARLGDCHGYDGSFSLVREG